MKDNNFLIYTDGACSCNPGPGAYAYIIVKEGEIIKQHSEGFQSTTNNRMELLAVIKALSNTLEGHVDVFSDSKYVIDSINKGWLSNWQRSNWKDRKNRDLWEEFLTVSAGRDITYSWVQGHANDEYNNKCDRMAREAINKLIKTRS